MKSGRDRTSGYYQPHLETMSPADRAAYLDAQVRAAVRLAYERAPGLRRRLEAAGVRPEAAPGVAELEAIPVLPKASLPDLQRDDPPFGGLLAVPVAQLRRLYVSPGPIYDPEGASPDYWRLAKAFYAAGFRPGDVVLNTAAYHLTPLGLMWDEGLGTLGCAVVPSGPGNTETQVKLLRELPITGFVGTPAFLMTVLQKAEELGGEARTGLALEVALVGGEMLPESMRSELEARHGLLVRQMYGTADIGTLGYECPAKAGMHVPEEVFVELVDPATGRRVAEGEVGEVVCTVFNPIYPLIRFGTGDLSLQTSAPCPCGRTSPRLLRIVGRVSDGIKVRGMFVYPRQIDEALARHPEVRRAQLVVRRLGHHDLLTVRAEAAEAPADLKVALEATLRETLKLRAEVELVPAGTLPSDAKKVLDERTWE